MARGDKLAGAMGKSPSMAGMTRVSPGVYRNAQGQLVRGMGGQPRPPQNQQQQLSNTAANAINGLQQYGNPPPTENNQTADIKYAPGQGPTMEQMQQIFGQMQQAQPQSDRFVGDPWRAMRDGSGKGGLQNMALRARNQNQQMQQAAQQQAMQQAMQQQQQQPMPMPMPGRGYRR